jgi:hypothetical protein
MARKIAYTIAVSLASIGVAGGAGAAPVIIGTYYEETIRVDPCALDFSFACTVPFTKVRSGKKLTLTRIACNISVRGEPMTTALFIQNNQGVWERMQPLTPAYIAQLDPNKFYGFNTQTFTVVLQGKTPLVWSRFNGTNVSMDCQIAGEIVTYP